MEGRQSGRRSRRRAGTALALAALLALAPALGRAATPEAQIAEIARAARHPDLRWPRFPDYQTVVLALYEPRGFAPLWLEDGRPTAAAAEATRALGGADAQGLAAADYDAARLEAARRELARGARATAETLARFDTGLTLGLLRLVSDLHVGRVDPQRLAFGYDVGPKRYDLAALVAAAVRDGDIARIVAEAPPALGQHRRLVEQLARYRALAADTSVGPVLVRGTLRPGDPSQGTDGLARWLAALGDLPAPSGGDASLVYDGELVEAVRRFQARHGLAVDGVIGPATARALAVPAEQRVRQIEWALERLRWIPALPHERAVFVNIPAFELFAVDAVSRDEPAALRMRVVVGRAGTRTPAFTGTLATVVFAPYWNVPRSITVNEQLPKLRRDPGALAGGGFEIARGATVLPATAASVEELAAGRAQLRQRPGPRNALGRVKFLFPNSHSVYLHDTPARQLFAQSRRDFSHGCIRVEQPAALAEWVLRDDPAWPPERMQAAMAAARETHVRVRPPVAVVILYATAVARRDGTISFYEDLYGHDAALERALAGGYPYPS